MTVDYFHGIYAADLSLEGGIETASAIASLLQRYELVGEMESLWCLDAEHVAPIDPSGDHTARNVGMTFGKAHNHPAHHDAVVTHLAGSELDPGDNWAWASFVIVSGPDYRLATTGEAGAAEIVDPPRVDHDEVPSFCPEPPTATSSSEGWAPIAFGAETFDASTGCTPPVCQLSGIVTMYGEPVAPSFDGVWRTGLLIHSYPEWETWSPEGCMVLPETSFRSDLVDIMSGKVHELGYVW